MPTGQVGRNIVSAQIQGGTYYAIVGNVGLEGVTLTFEGGTVTSNATGDYAVKVRSGADVTITPTKAGYIFSPTHTDYYGVTADEFGEDYTASPNTFTISGNAGVEGVTLTYTDGTEKTVQSIAGGGYTLTVSYNWSGTVVPTLTGYVFDPTSKAYTNILADMTNQDYTATAEMFTDDFTTTKEDWTGTTWVSSGGAAINTPVTLTELVTNGEMETGDPPTGFTPVGGAAASSVADERTGGAGSKSLNIVRGTADDSCGTGNIVCSTTKWHRFSFYGKSIDLSGGLTIQPANALYATTAHKSTSWLKRGYGFFPGGWNGKLYMKTYGAEGQAGRFDSVSIQEITNSSELFRTVDKEWNDAIASIDVTSPIDMQGGIVFCLDSTSDPQNYLLSFMRNNIAYLWQVKAGTAPTSLGTVAATYVAGRKLQVVKNGVSIKVIYNVDKTFTVDADATVAAGTLHGIFAFSEDVSFGNFSLAKVLSTGTKFTLLGDSIMYQAQGCGPQSVRGYERNGHISTYVNRAIGDARIIGTGSPHLEVQVTAAASDDATKIIILAGTNDTDTTDLFRSTYQSHVETLKSTNTNAKIYLVGILDRYDGITRRTVQNPMIAAVAANTGSTYIDTDGLIEDADLLDHLHPTFAGGEKIANLLIPYLLD